MSRREISRDPLNNILIIVEGKSEKRYFSHFKERNSNIEIFIIESDRTDPINMVNCCVRKMGEEDIDVKNGDLVFCVMDADSMDKSKREQMAEALKMAEENGINAIIFNPFLEVWFLMHFRNVPIPSITKEQVDSELRDHIGMYKKGDDVWTRLKEHTDKALEMARKIANENSLSSPMDFFETNYSTNIHMLHDEIMKLKKRNSRR